MTDQTILQRVESIAGSNGSTDEDGKLICYLAQQLGFPGCVVSMGIVYLDGQGTMKNPPMSISQFAGTILKVVQKELA